MKSLSDFFHFHLMQQPVTSGRKVLLGCDESVIYTSIGIARDTNEDRSTILEVSSQTSKLIVAVVSDGMGGMSSGDEVSSLAISSFLSYIIVNTKNTNIRTVLQDATLYSNYRVKKIFGGSGGATLAAVAVFNNAATCVHVGDSRIYMYNTKFDLLTVDDTPAFFANKNSPHVDFEFGSTDNRLMQYIGHDGNLDVHLSVAMPLGEDKNVFVLTSDGAHYIGTNLLNKIRENTKSNTEFAKRVISTAEWTGNNDNSTMIILNISKEATSNVASLKEHDIVLHMTNYAIKLYSGYTSEEFKNEICLINEYKTICKNSNKELKTKKAKSRKNSINQNRLPHVVSKERPLQVTFEVDND